MLYGFWTVFDYPMAALCAKVNAMNATLNLTGGITRHFAAVDHGSDAAKPRPWQTPSSASEARPAEILVPMDFSACALNALQTAVGFAQRCGARITLVHVIDLNMAPGYRADTWKIEQNLIAETKARFTKVVGSLPASVRFATKIVKGQPWEQILKVASERGIDLIIMGKRKPAFWDFLRRRTAWAVMEKAACDVVLVPENNKKSRNLFEKTSVDYQSAHA